MIRRLLFAVIFAPTLSFAQAPRPAQQARPADAGAVWNLDPTHSELSFEIRHFVSRVHGTFGKWKGTVRTDLPDWSRAAIDVEIDVSSIDTNNGRRDADLRSPNFFAADSFPTIAFRSTRIERDGDDARIHGNLTMRGVTLPVVLAGKFLGTMKAGGGERLGFEASTTIDRTKWGITWNRAAEGGGVMLGDEVKIELAVAAVRQAGTP